MNILSKSPESSVAQICFYFAASPTLTTVTNMATDARLTRGQMASSQRTVRLLQSSDDVNGTFTVFTIQ